MVLINAALSHQCHRTLGHSGELGRVAPWRFEGSLPRVVGPALGGVSSRKLAWLHTDEPFVGDGVDGEGDRFGLQKARR